MGLLGILGAASFLLGVGAYLCTSSWVLTLILVLLPSLGASIYACNALVYPHHYVPQPDHSKGLPTLVKGYANVVYQGLKTNPKMDYGLEYKDVEIPGKDHVQESFILRGWYIDGAANRDQASLKTCIVCVHGAGRDRRNFHRHAPMWVKAGLSTLSFDCREHGISTYQGRGVGFATREVHDIATVVEYVRSELGYNKVVLLATSQGAASAIVSAGFLNTPIDALIAENPWSRRSEMLAYVITTHSLGTFPGLAWFAKFLHFIVDQLVRWKIGASDFPDPIDVVHKINTPILFMHGTDDVIIHQSQSENLYKQASQPKQLWIADDAKHTGLYDMYPEEFANTCFGFLKKHGVHIKD